MLQDSTHCNVWDYTVFQININVDVVLSSISNCRMVWSMRYYQHKI